MNALLDKFVSCDAYHITFLSHIYIYFSFLGVVFKISFFLEPYFYILYVLVEMLSPSIFAKQGLEIVSGPLELI